MKSYKAPRSLICSPSSKRCRRWPYFLLLTSVLGLALIAFLKICGMEWIVDQQVAQKLRLIPGTDTYSKWKDVPLPIIIKFRLFNVTNPIEVQNGAKPKLLEAGPYTYEERREKEIVAMDSERDTITYRQRIFYTFRPDLSVGSEDDRLIVINVPFVTLSKLTYDNVGNFTFGHALADRNMRQRGERLFTYATAREYIFEGYSVQHYLNFLKSPALQLFGGVKIPKSISTGRFGFYLGKNGSHDGEYVIRTGKTNSQEFGQIVSWDGKTKLDYYSGVCNLINGSDGSVVPPFVTKETKIRFFSSDICRSIYMIHSGENAIEGIQTYRFKTPSAEAIFKQRDFCFCPTGKNNECFQQGVLSMAPCRDGAPIAMSSAHFLETYEGYMNGVEGLNPNKDTHETFIDIEPKTGLILRAAKRVQFNVMVHPNKDMSTFSQIRSTLFPFMWVEEMVEPTEAFLDHLREQLILPMERGESIMLGGLVSCTLLIILGIYGTMSTCLRHNSSKDPVSHSKVSSTPSSASFASASTGRTSSRASTLSTTPSESGSIRSEDTSSGSRKSAVTVSSVGTMTTLNENKGTMTESSPPGSISSSSSSTNSDLNAMPEYDYCSVRVEQNETR